MTKRIIALLLALILTVGLLPTVALAAGGTKTAEEPSGVDFVKKLVTKNGKDYLCLEALVNGDIKTVKSVTPCDIVLVLDQSGSMDETVKQTTYTYKEVDCKEWSYNKVGEYLKKGTKLYYQPCWQCGEAHEVQYWKNFHLFDEDTYQIGYQCGWYRYALRDNGRDSESTSRDYVFYTGKLYTRTTKTTSTNKYQALKEAASAFLKTVSENAKQNKVDHRVAIVGFGSAKNGGYTNTEILTLKGQNGNVGKNYSWLQADDYKNALVSCNTASGGINPTLTNAVEALAAEGATAVDLGLKMANNIFKNQTTGTYTGENARAKIVVVVTDGNPTHSDGFENNVATTAIQQAKAMKDASTKVFTIGIALDGDNAKNFISYVSSDYLNATSWSNPGQPIDAAPKYTSYVSDAEAMKEIFSDIASEATSVSASAKLTQTAVLTDTISQYFKLPEGATKDSIEVYTSAAKFEDGAFTWDTEEKLTNANVKIDGQKIEVTGFDYTANCVTKTAKNKEGNDFGKKLVIYIPIEKDATKAQFGGYLPTNTDATLGDTNGDTGFTAQSAHKDCTVVAPKLAGKTIEINAGESATTTELFKNITPNDTEWPDGNNNAGVDLKYTIMDEQRNTIATAEVPAGTSTVTWTFADGKTDANQYAEAGEYKFTINCEATCKNKTAHEGSTANSKQATGIIKVEPTTATVTLTKEITGSLTDAEKQSVMTNLKVYAKLDENNKTELVKGSDGKYSATLQAGNYTIEETNYTVDGYTCTSKLNNSDTFMFTVVAGQNQTLTLTNTYEKTLYTVTYTDGVGNEAFTDVTKTAAYKEDVPAYGTSDPTRADYTFNGWKWYKETDRNTEIDKPETMPAYNLVAVAQWKEKDKVTINYVAKTGGTVAPSSETLNPDTGTAAGSTATAGTGYTFDGWYDNEECTGNALSTSAEYKPTKPTTGWVNGTTFYAKFTRNTATLELNGLFKKQLNSDVSLDDVPADGKTFELTITRGDFTATGTATVTSLDEAAAFNFSTSRVLTFDAPDTYTYTVKETNSGVSGMEYAENGILTVEVGQNMTITSATIKMHANTDPVSISANEPCTIVNTYTQPTETFNLNTLIKKHFTKADDSAEIPNENFTFTATIESYPNKEDTYIGTVTMNGAENDKYFDFGDSKNLTLTPGTYQYRVTEELGTDTRIRYDSSAYILTISVENDGSYNVSVEPEAAAAQSLTTAAAVFPDNKQITFTNTYFEKKDPNALYLDFSKFVKKELTATGSKTVDEATFIVDVVGSYDGGAVANALIPNETQATMDEDVLNTTLTATIKNIVGGNVYEVPFNGYVTVSKPGPYTFTLTEHKDTQSGVTYDEAHYQVFVNIMRVGDNLVIHDATTYLNNEQVELINLVNDVPVTAGYIVFKNTIDTGKDDYYPIIIPTIINKDTGMLNKTDHFAYVIGYPDGTVHPNGQITRAEVATIFFRLLRDEVRDGAFTTSNTYSDVAYGKWYNNPISTMSALGIITGYPDGTFKPNKPITRAEFAAIAARFDETQSGKSATFSDVIGHWAAKEIGIAYYNDWIKGYPDGTFKPDQNITRAEAMTLINRVLERKPESPADLLTNMNKWTDNMDTSKWYYLDVQEATNSHGYTRKTFNYELWRQMLPDPDWSRYER